MTSKVIAFAAVLAAALLLVGPNAQVAKGDGATVVDDFGCVIIPADSGLPVLLVTDDSHAVQTPQGNINFTCDFTFDPALCPDSKAIRNKGFLCGAYFDLTTDTKAITDCTEGTVHLSCQVNGSSD